MKLSQFLNDNNCYDEFITNTKKDWGLDDIHQYIKNASNDPKSAIAGAFNWAISDAQFWCLINDKWKEIENQEFDLTIDDFK